MKFTQEERLDYELSWGRVKAHITHLRQPQGCYYDVITVASPVPVRYEHLETAITGIYAEAHVKKISDLGALISDRFAEMGFGVALCHHRDNFSRKRGRIIAKGRLLKLIKLST